MNRVFKVVWSETLNAYVVASEFAKGRTKSASARKLLAVLIASGMMGAGFVGSADAATLNKGEQQITIQNKNDDGTNTEIKTIFYIESKWPTNPYAAGGYSSISTWSGHAANNYDNLVQGANYFEGTNNISLGLKL